MSGSLRKTEVSIAPAYWRETLGESDAQVGGRIVSALAEHPDFKLHRAERAMRNVPLFQALDDAQLQVVAGLATRQFFRPGETLATEGEPATALLVIVTGRARVFLAEAGAEITLRIAGPGDVLAENCFFDGGPLPASAVAVKDCMAMALKRTDLAACMRNSAGIAKALLRGLVLALRDSDRRIRSLALMDVQGRLAFTLIELARDRGGVLEIKPKLNQIELAALVGNSRESVNRTLREFEQRGYITVAQDRIIIHDRARLNAA